MMRGGKTLIFSLSGLLLAADARALVTEAPGSPYHGIADRNVFNLKPPGDPASAQSQAPPPPKLTLTGITTIFGNKRALMKMPVPAKPPEPARDESYILTEGQRDGEIEVLSIDDKACSVRVKNHGVVQELTFEKDGAIQPGGFIPPVPSPRALPGGLRGFPGRGLRTPAAPGTPPTPAAAPISAVPVPPAVPPADQPATPVPAANTRPAEQLTPEEEAILIEAQRLQNQQEQQGQQEQGAEMQPSKGTPMPPGFPGNRPLPPQSPP
jgi:hypothetical protein